MRSWVLLLVCIAGLVGPGIPESLLAQMGWRDLVVTGGMSGEGYQGNLPSAGTALSDSTETAAAVVGELGVRGEAYWRRNGATRLTLFMDGGMRQFAARGFQQRDYAPREWVGEVEGVLHQPLGASAVLSLHAGTRARAVEDRTPMPLYLQPGFAAVGGGLQLRTTPGSWDRVELSTWVERTDFSAPDFAPQIRLLDREVFTVRMALAHPVGTAHQVEGFLALDLSDYREQSTFNPEDPFRRDRTTRGRIGWNYQGGILARGGVEARLNRSNSRRPEYGALTVDGQLSTVIGSETVATLYLLLTAKRYRQATPFARLLPGEEANAASTAFLSLSRELAGNLDGALRLGWTRAETETGGDYFQRFGVSVLVTYRPLQ